MGHFSAEIYTSPGSTLSGNQHLSLAILTIGVIAYGSASILFLLASSRVEADLKRVEN